jgi:hypothetical protein
MSFNPECLILSKWKQRVFIPALIFCLLHSSSYLAVPCLTSVSITQDYLMSKGKDSE